MSLTKQDLVDIRDVIIYALDVAVNPRLESLEQETHENSVVLNEHTKLHHEHTNRFRILSDKVDDVLGRLKAVEADIKEVNALLDVSTPLDNKFGKLPLEQKVRKLHAAVLKPAEQLHVEL